MTGDRPDPPATRDAYGIPAATPSSPASPSSPAEQAGVLVNEVEGHLLAQAERDRARREAEALCARLPWLTGAQAEDVTRHYTAQRLDLTRELLRATIARAQELRGEYEARYATLRRALLRRHAACASAVLVCAVVLGTAASSLVR